jgi:NADH-quinone oxidoreductase subunit K
MQNIQLEYYLGLAAILFTIGSIGVLTRRNAIVIFMSLELMLNSVNLVFVAFSSYLGNNDGQIFVFFVMAVAAAEAAVGLAIVLALFRNKKTVYVDEVNLMKW